MLIRRLLVATFRNTFASVFQTYAVLNMETKRCVNCFVFSWPQLEERGGGQVQGSQPDAGAEKMKMCGKCKFVYYCSRQCQEEHWEKVTCSVKAYVLFCLCFPLNNTFW